MEEVEAPRKINLERAMRQIDADGDLYVAEKQDHGNTIEIRVKSRKLESGTAGPNHTPTVFEGKFPLQTETARPKVVNATFHTSDAKDKLERAIANAVAEATPAANKLDRSRPRPYNGRVGNHR